MGSQDPFIYAIAALLPLSASMLVLQANPYNALVIRGILGAIAALLYSVLGAPDVALTEALVGTLLAITLYAIAVRSSLVMRLGILENEIEATAEHTVESNPLENGKIELPFERDCEQLLSEIRGVVSKRYMQLEVVPYPNTQALYRALIEKEIHAYSTPSEMSDRGATSERKPSYQTAIRVKRLYDILQAELSSSSTALSYASTSDVGSKEIVEASDRNLKEQQI
jgi:putative multicomponent Na+:H+ antiporter subunit B